MHFILLREPVLSDLWRWWTCAQVEQIVVHVSRVADDLSFLCVQVLLNAAPSFLNVFYRLVASIMQEGRQRAGGDTGNDFSLLTIK